MHELGIVSDILRIACREAEARKADKILTIKIKAGRLSGLTRDHLQNTFDLISEGTPASGAVLEVENVNENIFMISDIEMEAEEAGGAG